MAPVDPFLPDQALVGLGDGLAQVLVGSSEGVAEELDLGGREDRKDRREGREEVEVEV